MQSMLKKSKCSALSSCLGQKKGNESSSTKNSAGRTPLYLPGLEKFNLLQGGASENSGSESTSNIGFGGGKEYSYLIYVLKHKEPLQDSQIYTMQN